METATSLSFAFGLLGCIFGFMGMQSCVDARSDQDARMHPKNFTKTPYCETAKIQDQEYKRCWKTEEIK